MCRANSYTDVSREDLEILYDKSLERIAALTIELRKLSNKWHRLYHKRMIPLERCNDDDCIKRARLTNTDNHGWKK